MKASCVILRDVTVAYNGHPAVHHINGTFSSGTMTAIAGPNGAGKSTLLKAIAGLLNPCEGSIHINNNRKASIAYLPQASELNRDFPLTVLQMAILGFWSETKGKKAITKEHREKALQAIDAVGMRGFESRKLSTLSAGQFQRILFARVMLQDASLMLLDEPFTAIDMATTEKLIEIIHRWHNESRTIICVLHDFEQIKEHFPDCLLMSRKCIGWGKTKEVLKPAGIFKTRMFCEAWNDNASVCTQI